eukprot:CAMPEP_0170285888 /NCGR_PEP_ID=MMETSP0116_2-20130129/42998_1 /TAXON_ID=400756 /ORGANISM="Durinskia baltica, Strain CSIRO CS-38" /LENGTH=59 /DNA_ID=CAMNT_0010537299 /DNA_START=96 /DNA_END=275 /DNA_ORIENTATION=+
MAGPPTAALVAAVGRGSDSKALRASSPVVDVGCGCTVTLGLKACPPILADSPNSGNCRT